jgi:hypothetical protein
VTQQDPNVTTTPEGEQVVLEPGDEGYVEPNAPEGEPTVLDAQPMPVEIPPPTPPGEDLTIKNVEGQSESEAILMARGTVVESTSPTDIVPNTPQIRPFPVETEPEAEVPPEEPPEEPEAEVEPEPEQTDTSAAALIARAQAATTTAELDEIEALANERVTVLDAVDTRRAELGGT